MSTPAIWYLESSNPQSSGPEYYEAERSETKVSGGNQDLKTEQNVGLIYPSEPVYI